MSLDLGYYSYTVPDALAAGVTDTANQITLVSGATFPDPALTSQYTVIVAYGTSREEICTVTAKPTATTLTVLRAQDSTPATAKNAGDVVVHGVSGRDFREIGMKVDKAGDTMTGPLVLPGAPTTDLQAATKKYVDDVHVAATGQFVDVAGDTMTGPLVLPGPPVADLEAATKKYVDDSTLNQAEADALYVDVAGDAMTGPLAMGNNKVTGVADPTETTDAMNWQTAEARYVNTVGGDTMAADLTITSAIPFNSYLNVDAPAAYYAATRYRTGTKVRWAVGKNNLEETGYGPNDGGDFSIDRYADDGTTKLGSAMTITRETGNTEIYRQVSQKVNIAPAAGWADIGGAWAGLWVTRIGEIVVAEGVLSPTGNITVSVGESRLMGTIPVGFRPGHTVIGHGLMSTAGAGSARIDILTDGKINVSAPAAGTWTTNTYVGFTIAFRSVLT